MNTLSPWSGMLLLMLVLPVQAATETATDGLRRCSRETDERQRLACFDALANALPKIKEDQFGMTANIVQKRDPTGWHDPKKEEISGKIVALRQSATGQWIFTLDNGQVWIQADPNTNTRFVVGETVRLEHGAMSSLWLAADHGRMTRVKRIS